MGTFKGAPGSSIASSTAPRGRQEWLEHPKAGQHPAVSQPERSGPRLTLCLTLPGTTPRRIHTPASSTWERLTVGKAVFSHCTPRSWPAGESDTFPTARTFCLVLPGALVPQERPGGPSRKAGIAMELSLRKGHWQPSLKLASRLFGTPNAFP